MVGLARCSGVRLPTGRQCTLFFNDALLNSSNMVEQRTVKSDGFSDLFRSNTASRGYALIVLYCEKGMNSNKHTLRSKSQC